MQLFKTAVVSRQLKRYKYHEYYLAKKNKRDASPWKDLKVCSLC